MNSNNGSNPSNLNLHLSASDLYVNSARKPRRQRTSSANSTTGVLRSRKQSSGGPHYSPAHSGSRLYTKHDTDIRRSQSRPNTSPAHALNNAGGSNYVGGNTNYNNFRTFNNFKKNYPSFVQKGFKGLRRFSKADFGRINGPEIPFLLRGKFDLNMFLKRFEKQSTFHGICHAATAPNGKCRLLWYLAFFICLSALILQIILLGHRYFLYEKTVDLDLKFESAPFPSVTLCNLNPYKASAIQNDPMTKSTMDAFTNLMNRGTSVIPGIAQELAAVKSGNIHRAKRENLPTEKRRYLQVIAHCYCEVNTLSGVRKKGSCFAAFKGNISLTFAGNNLQNFHPSKCLCQLDRVSKTLWPCFPQYSWEKKTCTKCVKSLGHCPMIFTARKLRHKRRKLYRDNLNSFNSRKKSNLNNTTPSPPTTSTTSTTPTPINLNSSITDCRCHEEYNHCVISPENGHIPEIVPDDDLEDVLNREELSPLHSYQTTTTTTTTQAPALVQALGLEELTDEIAITTQAQQNLIFAVGGKPMSEKIGMSQPMDELILKCSFNQRDCDFENDFKLHYDATYGNCYTFNHNRSRMVQANRAGANYGLRMLLFANTSEYLPTTESVGFRVTVHDKWITPFPDAFGYSAPTGFMTSFGVRMKQFIRLPHPYGKCLDSTNLDDSKQIYKGFNYSVEGCHRSCTQREVILSCGCSDPMYPTYNQSKVCSVSDPIARDCIKNTTQRLIREIADGTSKHECECHQPCIESGYEVSFSAARWPSGTSKVMECDASNDLCMEKYKKNAAMIQIFYEELNFETLTENPAYTLTSVLADLGGLTGLWIGASVVSLLEIIVLVVYLTQAWVQKKKLSFAQAHPSHFKRSPTTQSKKSIKNQSIESFSKHSVLEELDEPAPSPIQPEQQSNKSSTAYYLPPGAELPCICSYNAYGHIECMRVLCPEHGYLLRSKGICDDEMYDYDWDEEESEVGEEEAENIESGNNCEPPPGQHTKIDVIDELQEESTVTNNGAPSKSPTQKSKSSLHSEPNTDKQTPTRDVVSEDKSSSPRKLGRIFTVNSVEDMSGSSKGSTQKPGSKESPKASAHSKSNSDSKEKSLLPKKVSKSKSPQKSDKSRSSSQSSSNKDISSLATSHSSVDSKKSKGSRVSSHNSNSPLLG